ncbi:hypothetical protein INT45_006174 [Circinella minor]|uniref:Uncharacterized protein n=1 Tax=Circinella minor TaxID=1195481 RepID=A0A8H7RLM3_9FUNG|nr:hypothetical protein INT45_006174 [Circinella minor]
MLRPTVPTFRVNAQKHSQRAQPQSRRVQPRRVDQAQCTGGLWFNHRQNIRQHLLSGAHDNQLRQNQRQASPAGPSQQIPSIPNDSNQHDNSFEAAEAYNFDSDETSDSGDELVDDELNIPPSNVVANDIDELEVSQLDNEDERIPEDTAATYSTVLDFTGDRQRADNPNYPYRSKLDFILRAFFDADDHLLSLTMKRRTLELVANVIEIVRDEPDICIPTKYWAMWHGETHEPKIQMTTVAKTIVSNRRNIDGQSERVEENVKLYMYKPSELLKHLIANPKMSSHLSTLPDYTYDQRISLTQGDKWKTNPLFQHPMVKTLGPSDLWVGDFIVPRNPDVLPSFIKIFKFYTKDNTIMADAWVTEYASLPGLGDTIILLCNNTDGEPVYTSISLDSYVLAEHNDIYQQWQHHRGWHDFYGNLIYQPEPYMLDKHSIFEARYRAFGSNSTGWNRVQVVPLNLFTDDTSGNRSKKWNKFESWSMVPAGLPLEDRNKRENTFLVCLHNRLSAVQMLENIVDDLCELENGVVMYDAEYQETVLVIAPLNFITADNMEHAQIACHKGGSTHLNCHKCYHPKPLLSMDSIHINHHGSPLRNLDDIRALIENCELHHEMTFPDGLTSRTADAHGYKKTGGEVLLQLDAFDSTKGLPIKILHTMMLGPTKYLAFSTIKYLSAGETDQLQAKLRSYRSRAFGRVLGNCLQVKSTSFVERDFKIMAQQLPVIFNDLLHNEWSRKTEDRKHKLPIISKTPKLHYLHHLKEDLKRFATAIHTESEKGEQFNKFIREHIFHTNRHNPSRDVLELFG